MTRTAPPKPIATINIQIRSPIIIMLAPLLWTALVVALTVALAIVVAVLTFPVELGSKIN